jgi:hypothetical protein
MRAKTIAFAILRAHALNTYDGKCINFAHRSRQPRRLLRFARNDGANSLYALLGFSSPGAERTRNSGSGGISGWIEGIMGVC